MAGGRVREINAGGGGWRGGQLAHTSTGGHLPIIIGSEEPGKGSRQRPEWADALAAEWEALRWTETFGCCWEAGGKGESQQRGLLTSR